MQRVVIHSDELCDSFGGHKFVLPPISKTKEYVALDEDVSCTYVKTDHYIIFTSSSKYKYASNLFLAATIFTKLFISSHHQDPQMQPCYQ